MGPSKHESAPAGNSSAAADHFLQANKVWARYGVSSMTLFRWLKDERIGFPAPVYIGRLRFWKLSALETWEANKAAARSTGAA